MTNFNIDKFIRLHKNRGFESSTDVQYAQSALVSLRDQSLRFGSGKPSSLYYQSSNSAHTLSEKVGIYICGSLYV